MTGITAAIQRWTFAAAILLSSYRIDAAEDPVSGKSVSASATAEAEQFFETNIRPLLVARCFQCHSEAMTKGGLRLDSREGVHRGGDTGPVVIAGKPDESLLLQAVRHENGLKMPPDGRLTDSQISGIAEWIRDGAFWPGTPATMPVDNSSSISTLLFSAPDDGELANSLQLWLKADSLMLNDREPVILWPDHSGHGRDISAVNNENSDGSGLPPTFVRDSMLMKRPAVRFEKTSAMAWSRDRPVEIHGDAAVSIMLVLNLQRDKSAHDSGPQRFRSGRTTILTMIREPDSGVPKASFFLNGESVDGPSDKTGESQEVVPGISQAADFGTDLREVFGWDGPIYGDLGEVIIFNKVLSEAQRLAVEGHLAEKFGLTLPRFGQLAPVANFTDEEKNYWAWQPVVDSVPPSVINEAWIKSPVDRFVLKSLEASGLNPASPLDKRTLLRRVTFDLSGLPPTPDEVDSFLKDESPEAYERVVDRLLASSHYGERWARHWLDVVRFAETTANDANAVMRYAWRYRNYVIDAFNQNLPYDQFLIEQLAGDLLPPSESQEVNTRRIIATGYLMVGPKALAEADKEQSRLDIVDDQIDVTGRAFLGLTIACARCHDHKFDAIRTADYYALAGIFRSTEPFQNENRTATMWWEFPIPQGDGKESIVVMAPKEALPRNLRIHLRGNRFTLGATVGRGFVEIMNNQRSRRESPADVADSGRLELARWIANSENPLTARVMVNRIWQHHFGRGLVATSDNFGTRGERPVLPELLDWLSVRFIESGWSVKEMHRLIVLSNGYQMRNAESEATLLADSSISVKTSALHHRRRLSAEELRDAILAVSGRLDRIPGTSESGEYLVTKAENINAMIMPNRLAADDPVYTTFLKRSIYLPVVRNMLPDVLSLFDAADPNGVTAVRSETTVASQSLFLLNSPFVRDQALALAESLLVDELPTDQQRIERVHHLVFGRNATPDELIQAGAFLSGYAASAAAQARPIEVHARMAWQSYCQTLLCSNEFLYLE